MDGLDRMERCLTDLEQRPGDRELMDEIFRSVHTIKGSTGFLGFHRLELLAHAGENLLDSLREGGVKATPEVVSGLLQLLDVLRQILKLIEFTGGEGSRASDQDSGLVALLKDLNDTEGEFHKQEPVVSGESSSAPTHVPGSVSTLHPVSAPPAQSAGVGEQTLRVDVEVLNRMMNLVGELVLTRNQLLQVHSVAPHFAELTRRLDSVTADLRETVMQARMQPVGHLFGKFPRMVRDLARSCGKQIRLEFSGQETGLDKSLLEAIKDPLAHAVRNAVDHGIEEPSGRALAGKPLEGVIRLQARQHNGSVLIEVSDDGRGISIARVLEKAITRQLITAEQAAVISEREALRLLFLPGFSTLETVTHVSGRGVGMDVVLANVEKAGGTVELESREGQGTTLRLRLPLTLAIVPALVVRSGGQSFCLPQGSLAELVYVPERDAAMAVEHMGAAELYRLRETLLPMLRLDRMLGLPSESSGADAHGFYLVVLEIERCRFGLVVDDIMTPEEIVVKPLSAGLREIGLFSGATVLGNGMLAMIVDIAAIAARAGIGRSSEQAIGPPPPVAEVSSQEPFLIFEDSGRGLEAVRGFDQRDLAFASEAGHETVRGAERKALPLRSVERIESVAAHQVEYVGKLALLRYRGELLALEDAGSMLSGVDPETSLTILICVQPAQEGGQRRFGIVVRDVLDVGQGELLDGTARVCRERLAVVNDRLSVVHRGFCGEGVLEEVA